MASGLGLASFGGSAADPAACPSPSLLHSSSPVPSPFPLSWATPPLPPLLHSSSRSLLRSLSPGLPLRSLLCSIPPPRSLLRSLSPGLPLRSPSSAPFLLPVPSLFPLSWATPPLPPLLHSSSPVPSPFPLSWATPPLPPSPIPPPGPFSVPSLLGYPSAPSSAPFLLLVPSPFPLSWATPPLPPPLHSSSRSLLRSLSPGLPLLSLLCSIPPPGPFSVPSLLGYPSAPSPIPPPGLFSVPSLLGYPSAPSSSPIPPPGLFSVPSLLGYPSAPSSTPFLLPVSSLFPLSWATPPLPPSLHSSSRSLLCSLSPGLPLRSLLRSIPPPGLFSVPSLLGYPSTPPFTHSSSRSRLRSLSPAPPHSTADFPANLAGKTPPERMERHPDSLARCDVGTGRVLQGATLAVTDNVVAAGWKTSDTRTADGTLFPPSPFRGAVVDGPGEGQALGKPGTANASRDLSATRRQGKPWPEDETRRAFDADAERSVETAPREKRLRGAAPARSGVGDAAKVPSGPAKTRAEAASPRIWQDGGSTVGLVAWRIRLARGVTQPFSTRALRVTPMGAANGGLPSTGVRPLGVGPRRLSRDGGDGRAADGGSGCPRWREGK
nr:uncharacterized protein LOC125626093 [Caretta caretta]